MYDFLSVYFEAQMHFVLGVCCAQLPIGACWGHRIPHLLAPRSTGPSWTALTYVVSHVRMFFCEL